MSALAPAVSRPVRTVLAGAVRSAIGASLFLASTSYHAHLVRLQERTSR